MPWSQEGTSYQKMQMQQPQEYENRQDMEHIRPKNRSNIFCNAVKAQGYQYQQGIEHIQPGVSSISSQILQADQIVNQQEEEHIRARPGSSALSGLLQAHKDENQQGIYQEERPTSEFDNQQETAYIDQPRERSRLLGANQLENQQVIEHIRPRLNSISELAHTNEYDNQQLIEYIRPKHSSIFELVDANGYESQQGIEHVRPRLSSISELAVKTNEQVIEYFQPSTISKSVPEIEFEYQQAIENIQPKMRSISKLVEANKCENQQGINNIQSRLSSISEPVQANNYDDKKVIQNEIKFNQVRMISTMYTEMPQAQDVENFQQVDHIQPKLRSTVVTEVHQQEKQSKDISSKHANQDEYRQGIDQISTKESSSTKETTEHENQQKIHAINLKKILDLFPENRFTLHVLKSYEHLN